MSIGRYGLVVLVHVLICCVSTLGSKAAAQTAPPFEHEMANDGLLAVVDRGVDNDPGAWYVAVSVLGESRSVSAIPSLVRRAWLQTGPDGPMPPDRPPGFSDYPAAVALSKIGFPAVNPLIKEYVEQGRTPLVPALILTAMMPEKSAIASIDAYQRQRHGQMDDVQLDHLKKLRDVISSVVHSGRPVIPVLDKEVRGHHRILQRAKAIESQLRFLRATSDWTKSDRQVFQAIRTLGELRASEASKALVPQIRWTVNIEEAGKANGLTKHPAALALLEIGLPAVDPMLQQVIQGDQPEATRDIVARVLADMMPPEVAITFVDAAIASQKNELAKQRLVDLRKTLSKLAEELKKKRENKDQP